MAMVRVLFAVLPLLAVAGNLRGNDVEEVEHLEMEASKCTGEGNLPKHPVCFGGKVLVESFSIHVTSYDGEDGTVNLKAEGPQSGLCEGAKFESEDNIITIENDEGCGLNDLGYEYTVRYCPDQDHLVVNILKPYFLKMVLKSETCPDAGEV
eukprot:CAMPEP_0181453800 /NCGR_PEP_ID=MMETSP1110-20121109/29910_1 /TAXON_ID=174948 /ORGANISM="Symbiodinium sp., Strain CCMP421" /LENGTH=151 /DNA_ID=CAMNT_0023578127 /DNA_START=55 /DNA_END=510 /DNA_ORIENTATION=+